MKPSISSKTPFWAGVTGLFLFGVLQLHANPISIPPRPVTPEITETSVGAILLEVVCVAWLLRRFRAPRFFILWLLGMHVLTYPVFVGLLWMMRGIMPPIWAVAFGEGLIVIIEGSVIFLICRYGPSPAVTPAPTLDRCWLVSLIGNGCSFVAFPILVTVYEAMFGRPF